MKAKRIQGEGKTRPLPQCLASTLFTLFPLLSTPAWSEDSASIRLANSTESAVVSLDDHFSQTDIARLRAQARGAGDAFIAYPRLILNGRTTAQMLPVQVYGEEVAVDTEALAAQGIKIPGAEKAKWQTLTELGIAGRYDNNAQQVTLLVPAKWLPHQSLSAGLSPSTTPINPGKGALLNYDAYSTWLDNGDQQTSASHELRLFDHWGVASSSGLVRWNDNSEDDGDYVRLDSYWRHTNPQNMQTWVAGDAITGALNWTPSVRLGGIQLSRNFASRPDLITFPLPQISGSATLPSALQVFVNDLRLTDQAIQPGPFVLETAPQITGLGEAQIVTTDTLGRQVTQTIPFYVSPKLLKPGLWDYSASLGTPRRNYARRSNDYDGQPVATGVARYGINEQYTVEATSSASKELFNTGVGLVARPGLWGVSNLALAYGQEDGNNGAQWVAGHEFRVRRYAVSGQYTGSSKGYRDLSNTLDNALPIKRTVQLNGSLNMREHGSVSASYLDTTYFSGSSSRFLVLGHNRTLWRQLSVNLSVNQNLNDSDDRTWLAGFLYRFQPSNSRPIQAGIRFEHKELDGDTNTIMTMSQQAEEFWDTGWDLAYSPDTDGIRQARGRWWTPYADLQAGIYGTDTETNSFANVSGSVVTNYEGVFAANTMHDSFAIVDTGGYPDIPVRRSNRLIGHTNSKGRLLLPNILPWQDNKLAIDVNNLPADVRFSEDELTIKPSELTGVTAHFDVQQINNAIILVQDSAGNPIAAGARVLLPNANATVVGFGGEAYLEDVSAGENEIGIISNGSLCTVTFDYTPTPGSLQQLGPFGCLSPSERQDTPQEKITVPIPEPESVPDQTMTSPSIETTKEAITTDIVEDGRVLLKVRDKEGNAIPEGARVLIPKAEAATMGAEGEVLLQGLTSGQNEIGIISRAGLCTVKFTFTPEPGTLSELGPFTCLSPSEQE
ncbi:fimbria/pilus outer membrane usher protein [Alcanivorax sp. S6407]|uniref:fimbria/pilus outer membrane usher protein n=1 Tax=Alcanivorax sp. S6407 TaxID=2926424 RepID=UPI001FF11411|nr:fimbria/pilus outer membrane usher protein [Alcanivorax sp. S6407]